LAYANDFLYLEKDKVRDCLISDCHSEDTDINHHIETNKQIFEDPQILEYDEWFVDKNENRRRLSIKKIPIINQNNIVKAILCIAHDITEQYDHDIQVAKQFEKHFDKEMKVIKQTLNQTTKTLDDIDDKIDKDSENGG
jgi:hypothetical protein